MSTRTETPEVWLGCLASRNAGRLHGRWVPLTPDTTEADVWEAIESVLASSPVSNAEEWYAGDYSAMPHLGASATVAQLVEAVPAPAR